MRRVVFARAGIKKPPCWTAAYEESGSRAGTALINLVGCVHAFAVLVQMRFMDEKPLNHALVLAVRGCTALLARRCNLHTATRSGKLTHDDKAPARLNPIVKRSEIKAPIFAVIRVSVWRVAIHGRVVRQLHLTVIEFQPLQPLQPFQPFVFVQTAPREIGLQSTYEVVIGLMPLVERGGRNYLGRRNLDRLQVAAS